MIPTTITLPQDERARVQLERKLEEYKGRFQRYTEMPREELAKQPFNKYAWDAVLKTAVLSKLLQDGEVNGPALFAELVEKHGEIFNPLMFIDAFGVIADYINTGGANARGGTGLPPAETH